MSAWHWYSSGWKTTLYNCRSFSSSVNLWRRRKQRKWWRVERCIHDPILPADHNECFILYKVTQPKYPFHLVLSALRAYSALPVSRERAIMAAIYMDRSKETETAKDITRVLNLPHPQFGPSKKVAVFAEGEMAEKARKVGGIVLGASGIPEYFQNLKDGKAKMYDAYLSSRTLESQMRVYARQMREKTPTAKKNMVFGDAEGLCRMIQHLKYTRKYTITAGGMVRFPVGMVWMTDEEILANLKFFADEVKRQLSDKRKTEFRFSRVLLNMSFGRKYHLDWENLL